jgi:NAD(P)-dependent dehydrogenase (short-subunit alcohol dehydrogenase family)
MMGKESPPPLPNSSDVQHTNPPSLLSPQPIHAPQRGAIVNIASIAGLRHSGAYTAAKHGVMGITRTAALNYPDVKIDAIAPGYIKTPLTDAPGEMRRNALDKVENWTPMGRFGLPEEIAEGVVWLLGWRSSFVHGSVLAMDGGNLAQRGGVVAYNCM